MDAGLFGGTFNPLHNGHLGIISHVKTAFDLDRVILIPSAVPPHKHNTDLISAALRLRMVEETVEQLDGFQVSDMEMRRSGPSFTIDTIREFKATQAPGDRCYFMLGSDAFFDIPTWKETKEIFAAVSVIVMHRGAPEPPQTYGTFIDEHIATGYTWNQDNTSFIHPRLHPIHICAVPRIDISSTLIRSRIQQGQSISDLVPEPVEALIIEKELYT